MNKQPSALPRVSIVPFVRSLRPAAATGYRLWDGQGRLFPPIEQPPYYARARVDRPDVPAGLYGIRFEDAEGNDLVYTDDGSIAAIQLDQSAAIRSPHEVEAHRERNLQVFEKSELRHKRKHIRNGSLQNVAGILNDTHGLIFESHREVEESQKYVVDMIRNVMDLQRTMLEQQKSLNMQAQSAAPQAPEENWASSMPKILRELGEVAKAVMSATANHRAARSASTTLPEVRPATAPERSIPVASVAEPSTKPTASQLPAPAQQSAQTASPLPLANAAEVSPPASSPAVPTAPPDPSIAVRSFNAESPSAPASSTSSTASAVSAPLAPSSPPEPLAVPAQLVALDEPPGALVASAPPSLKPPAVAHPTRPLALSAPSMLKSQPSPRTSQLSSALPPPVSPASAPLPFSGALSQHSGYSLLPTGHSSLLRALPRAAPAQAPPHLDPHLGGARTLLWRLRCLIAQGLWKEIKRRIISLPESTLHKAVSNRETFLAWLQWVAEPAKLLRGNMGLPVGPVSGVPGLAPASAA